MSKVTIHVQVPTVTIKEGINEWPELINDYLHRQSLLKYILKEIKERRRES